MKIRYTNRARDDLEIAFDWYEEQRKGLGLDFLACIEEGILLIEESPRLFHKLYSRFRCLVIRRFPFTIFYTIEETEIVVHAVFHQSQRPERKPQ